MAVCGVAVAGNSDIDLLLKKLIQSREHNLLNIPVADIDDVVHVELGIVLKKIAKVVRTKLIIIIIQHHFYSFI